VSSSPGSACCVRGSAASSAISAARSPGKPISRPYWNGAGARRAIRSQQQRQRGWKLYSFHAPEVECIGKGKASAPYELMAWTTPALSGNLEAPEHQEHKPCPIRTLRQSVSILGRTSFMSLVLMLPVQSRYEKNDPEINSNNRWQIYRHA
jgi:hypothetical protein